MLPKYGLGQISDIGVVVVEVALDERIVEVGDEDDEDLGLLLLTLVVELDAIVTGYSEEEEEEEKEDETDEKEDDEGDPSDPYGHVHSQPPPPLAHDSTQWCRALVVL